jgi:hypothetical protein
MSFLIVILFSLPILYMDGYRPPLATIEHYSIYYVLYSLASLGTNACNLYTIYTSIRHEPVTLLMLHAVSLDRSMKIVLKEGEGITIK